VLIEREAEAFSSTYPSPFGGNVGSRRGGREKARKRADPIWMCTLLLPFLEISCHLAPLSSSLPSSLYLSLSSLPLLSLTRPFLPVEERTGKKLGWLT